jgi:hypothetical protein
LKTILNNQTKSKTINAIMFKVRKSKKTYRSEMDDDLI